MFLVDSKRKLVLFKTKHAERDFNLNVTTGIVLCFYVEMRGTNGCVSIEWTFFFFPSV